MDNKKNLIETVLFLEMIENINDHFLIPPLTERKIFLAKVFNQLEIIEKNTKPQIIQKVIHFLKNLPKNHILYQQEFYSKRFYDNVVHPLEQLMTAEEKKNCEKISQIAAEKLQVMTQGKTFQERWAKIKKILHEFEEKEICAVLDISLNGDKKND